MVRLMRSNFYRLFCSRFALIYLIVLFAFGVWASSTGGIYTPNRLRILANEITWEGVQNVLDLHGINDVDEAMEILYERQFPKVFIFCADGMFFLSIFFALIILNRDFANRTVRNSVQLVSRTKFILSKLLTVYIIFSFYCILICLYMLKTFTVGYIAPVGLFIRNFALLLLMTLGTATFMFFIAIVAKHPVFSLAGSFAALFILGRNPEILFPQSFTYSEGFWTSEATAGDICFSAIVSIFYCVVFAWLSVVVFKRVRIK